LAFVALPHQYLSRKACKRTVADLIAANIYLRLSLQRPPSRFLSDNVENHGRSDADSFQKHFATLIPQSRPNPALFARDG
jgi:hypothetical protein